MGWIDRIQVWVYDVFKLVVTVILLIIIALFFLRPWGPSMSASAGQATPVAAATDTRVPRPQIAAPDYEGTSRGFEIGQNELRGTAPGASQVQIVLDGEVIGTADVNPDGSWSLPFVLDRPGTYDLELRALDSEGLLASKRIGALDVADKLAMLSARAPSWDEWVPVDASRAESSLELIGEGEPGAVVVVRADEIKVGEIKVGDDGAWSMVEDVTVTFGRHQLVVEMSDTVGKPLDALPPIPFEVPQPAPTPTPTPVPTPTPAPTPTPTATPEPQVAAPAIVFPRNGDVVRAGQVGIRGTGAAELAGGDAAIEILDNDAVAGTVSVETDGKWRFEYELGEGSHTLVARVIVAPSAASEPVRLMAIPVDIECEDVAPLEESACSPNAPPGEDLGDTYIVAPCETLNLIAKRTGVSVEDILTLNPDICNPNLIFKGQVLYMPPRD